MFLAGTGLDTHAYYQTGDSMLVTVIFFDSKNASMHRICIITV